MSLQTRYRPSPLHAGPSAHSAPVHSRLIAEFACTRLPNAGSTLSTSGSVKYVVGGALGPKSLGGFVTVLGGPCGVCAEPASSACPAEAAEPRRWMAAPPRMPRALTA